MSVLISVIIPVYKVELYIEDCLRSVMNQTKTEGIECIIVDDCSPDQSMALAERCIAGYDGKIDFRIIHREKNGGLSAARNTGIRAARGEYLFFLDSDDKITEYCLEKLEDVAQLHPDAQIVQGSTRATNGGFGYLSLKDKRVKDYSNNASYIKAGMLMHHYPPTAWNKLIRRSWLLEHNLFFKEGLLHEDDYWQYFAAKCTTAYAICRLDTYIYNIRPGSITQAPSEHNIKSRIKSASDFMDNIDDFCRHAQLADIYRSMVCTYRILPQKESEAYVPLFKRLSSLCGIVGKVAIFVDLHVSKNILNSRLMKVLNDKIIIRLI